MSKFEVIRGVEGCCLVLDDTRIAGPKPWGGGEVIHCWETDKTYVQERTGKMNRDEYGYWVCSECGEDLPAWVDKYPANYCPYCGIKVVM